MPFSNIYVNSVFSLATHICFILLKKEEKRNLFILRNNLHNSTFLSYNLFMFIEEDGTTIKGTLMQIWNTPYMFVLYKNNTLKISYFES